MQAVIMAAGRGTRLNHLTLDLPKPLVQVNGKPIIEYTLSALPEKIDEILFVIKHLGNKIRENLGSRSVGKEIKFVEQGELPGTCGALWAAKPFLKEGRFLVLNGDDIYSQRELELCLEHNLVFGLSAGFLPSEKYIAIDIDSDSRIAGWHRLKGPEIEQKALIASGAFVLDKRIFDYEPVLIANGEYGLPQTILKMAEVEPVKGVLMDDWHQINYPRDIELTEEIIARKLG